MSTLSLTNNLTPVVYSRSSFFGERREVLIWTDDIYCGPVMTASRIVTYMNCFSDPLLNNIMFVE